MKVKKLHLLIISIFIFVLMTSFTSDKSSPNPDVKLVKDKSYGDGLVFKEYKHGNKIFYFIELDEDSAKWELRPLTNVDGICAVDNIKSIGLKHNPGIKCIVNASFFDLETNLPVGAVISGNEIAVLDNRVWPTFGITEDGMEFFDELKIRAYLQFEKPRSMLHIWTFNHPVSPYKSQVVAGFNRNYGDTVDVPAGTEAFVIQDNTVKKSYDYETTIDIPYDGVVVILKGQCLSSHGRRFKIGREVTINLENKDLGDLQSVVTGGPWLVMHSIKADLDLQKKDFAAQFSERVFRPNRRTVLGKTANNNIFISVFPSSMTLEETAEILCALDVKEAITLDGGASTGLWFDGADVVKNSRNVPVILAIVPK